MSPHEFIPCLDFESRGLRGLRGECMIGNFQLRIQNLQEQKTKSPSITADHTSLLLIPADTNNSRNSRVHSFQSDGALSSYSLDYVVKAHLLHRCKVSCQM